MREKLKRWLYLYQRSFWYVGIANGEARKPLAYLNEILLLLTFLAVRGVDVSTPVAIAIYIAVLAVAAVIGRILVATGIVAYNQRIANTQNPELLAILKEVRELNQKVDSIFEHQGVPRFEIKDPVE